MKAQRAPRWFAGATLLVLGGLAALLISLREGPARELDPLPRTDALEEDRVDAKLSPVLPTRAVSRAESQRGEAAMPLSPEVDSVAVEIVAPDGGPAAGADLFVNDYVPSSEPARGRTGPALGFGREFLTREARRYRADDQGVARFPRSESDLRLDALAEPAYAMVLWTRDGPARLRMELAEQPACEVKLVSSLDGRPVGGVVVEARPNVGPERSFAAISDAQGSARLWPLTDPASVGGGWSVAVPGAFRAPIRARFEPGARFPIRLTVPPSAPTTITLETHDGRRALLDGRIEVGWLDAEGDSAEGLRLELYDGAADLPRAELGLTLHLRAKLRDCDLQPRIEFESTEASLRRGATLRLERAVPILRARMLDAQGAPLASTLVQVVAQVWREGEPRELHETLRTDAAGVVRWGIGRAGIEPGMFVGVAFHARARDSGSLGALAHGALGEDGLDLGDVALDLPRRLLSGRVLAAEGGPAAGVEVALALHYGRTSDALGLALDSRTDAAGNFELRGWAEPGVLGLSLRGLGRQTRTAAECGAEGVELRLD